MIRILIVDDEKPICDLIDLNLTSAGYHCTAVQDGLKAIDLIEKEEFDLVLLDLMIPKISGMVNSSRCLAGAPAVMSFVTKTPLSLPRQPLPQALPPAFCKLPPDSAHLHTSFWKRALSKILRSSGFPAPAPMRQGPLPSAFSMSPSRYPDAPEARPASSFLPVSFSPGPAAFPCMSLFLRTEPPVFSLPHLWKPHSAPRFPGSGVSI